MTEPGAFEPLIKRLPDDVGHLASVVQGLLVHSEWLAAYGLDARSYTAISRATLPVSERLAALLNADTRAPGEALAPAQRAIGTCRDFALMLCSFLRTQGRPARVRCGFASYLSPNVMPGEGPTPTSFLPSSAAHPTGGSERWEDHWICEYWDNPNKHWLRADAQLDEVTRSACKVTFNTSDLPSGTFLTAGEAWRRCGAGQGSPDHFGNGTTNGLWFMAVDVIRDWHVVNNRETSPWDRWREASLEQRIVPRAQMPTLDDLARDPEQPISDLAPPWLICAAAYSRSGAG